MPSIPKYQNVTKTLLLRESLSLSGGFTPCRWGEFLYSLHNKAISHNYFFCDILSVRHDYFIFYPKMQILRPWEQEQTDWFFSRDYLLYTRNQILLFKIWIRCSKVLQHAPWWVLAQIPMCLPSIRHLIKSHSDTRYSQMELELP